MLKTASTATSEIWNGESLFSFVIRRFALPIMRSKQLLQEPTRYARFIQKSRSKGEAPPPARLTTKFGISSKTYAGAKTLFVEPTDGVVKRSIIYTHGGAYVAHLSPLQWNLIEGLAECNQARVIVPHYPLAPERDWRSAYAMLGAIYDDLMRELPADKIVLAGDSAGGGLALGFAQVLRDQRRPLPRSIVLFSPWLDLREDNPDQAALDNEDPILARPALVWAAKKWAGKSALNEPQISPLLGDLGGLPPILVFSGTADLLHADALALLDRAKKEGVATHLVIGERMTHAWSILRTREADRLQKKVAEFLR